MKEKYDAILVLGLKLHPDGSPAHELILRCETAVRCWKNGMAPIVIPCGGQTEGTPISESTVMASLLMNLGVPAEAIRREKLSQITVENFRNAKKMLADRERPRVLIVTSDYHVQRALWIARDLHMDACGIPSRTARTWKRWIKTRITESVSWIKYALRR